jgi:DNA-binding LacI/PurR family transcriptional regulator
MVTERTRKDRRAPIIGFLAARFDEAYQNAVWRGAVQEAERIGSAIVFFGGQRIGSPIGYEALDNIAFDLAKRSRMAGIIVMSNVIGTYLSGEEQLEFLGRFGRTQVVSIGVEFPGIPSVLVDAAGGMSSIAEHLLNAHGRRRFLFLAGPKGHIESEARLAEFMRSAEAGAPSLELIYGDFTEEDAHDKVTRFLDSGRAIDAIVAANDLMAVGAIRALAERGIDVPREVSVTGFDDTEDSRFSVPPLTTVRQPAVELGRLAVMRIAARIGLGPEPPAAHPTVSFVVRESCGCPYAPETEEAVDAEGHPYASWPPEPLAALSGEVNRDIREGRNPSRLRRLAFDPAIRDAALLAIAEGECRFLAS